jgi:hypothetical protein
MAAITLSAPVYSIQKFIGEQRRSVFVRLCCLGMSLFFAIDGYRGLGCFSGLLFIP